MSAWCGACHGRIHQDGGASSFKHPVDVPLTPEMARTYDSYRGTGVPPAAGAGGYLPLVPYEAPGASTTLSGPTIAGARVMCLTCHRAHASSAPGSGRWDFRIGSWREEGVRSDTARIPNPFQATAGPAQGPLCEVCHGSGTTTTPRPGPPAVGTDPDGDARKRGGREIRVDP
jgi:cytochrome c553